MQQKASQYRRSSRQCNLFDPNYKVTTENRLNTAEAVDNVILKMV